MQLMNIPIPLQPNNPDLQRYCATCGTDLEANGLFCQECGSPIGMPTPLVQRNVPASPATGVASQQPPISASHAQRKSGSLWPIVIVVVAAFLFFVFIWVLAEEEIGDSFQDQTPRVNDSRETELELERPLEVISPLPATADTNEQSVLQYLLDKGADYLDKGSSNQNQETLQKAIENSLHTLT